MPDYKPSPLNRRCLLILAALTIALGLLSRRYPIFGNYPGDALWASLATLGWGFLLPRARNRVLGSLALATSFAVELSQLYNSTWIDSARATLPGRLILGSGFDPVDLLAYTIGTLISLLVVAKLRE